MAPSEPASRHRAYAGDFAVVASGVADWSAPSPVAGWSARDVVEHLVTWFPAFLASGGIDLPTGPSSAEDPVASWEHQTTEVQALIEQRGDEEFSHPYAGTHRLADAVDRFYTADVFMHTWDLARAAGREIELDPAFCAELLSGMRGIEQVLRDSGQYGPAVAVDAGAPVQERLMGFIGRDPHWSSPG